LLAQLVEHLHGKEGVDGSSPSEGFPKAPANSAFVCLNRQRLSRAGTRGGSLTFAPGSHRLADFGLTKPLWTAHDPFSSREVVAAGTSGSVDGAQRSQAAPGIQRQLAEDSPPRRTE